MNETDLRNALRQHAESFRPDPEWLSRAPLRRRAWPRRIAMTSPLLVAATAAALYLVPGGASSPQTTDHNTTAAGPQFGEPAQIELAGYAAPVGGKMPKPLERHLKCMRLHGYDLPDPAWTGNGWLLTVKDAQRVGLGTSRWNRIVFSTCALTRPDGALTRPDGPGIPNLRHLLMPPRPGPGKPKP